ncbi:MAG: SPOR domain-containing protein [Muribaculaceae bacterium]|nr:SPOR domain-containing protein [Muribaculaceae bacterium]
MKKLPLFILLGVLALVGCKTSEANYKAAYEAAVGQQREAAALDSTIYGQVRTQARMSVLKVGNDSLPLKTEQIGYTENGGASRATLHRYNVVVGQFKQVFNARQMRERLMAGGYPDAVIVHTREPLYYVITASVSTPEEALREYERVKSDRSMVLKSPLPFILRPAHLAR